ncbi:acyltransferase family protein [Lichenicoccus sp.]|uniref:acyltransferase family protein n=1 Tax=Lichenicoccus sp. TaxID=2781899 RepID=UPI003D135248
MRPQRGQTRPGREPDGKIVFANQLRAVAALCVVLSHLAGVYILMGPLVGWITSSPVTHVGQPAILHLTRVPDFNFGAFGVAVFFLISGFVIPFSLRQHRAGAFLVARAFRIYPTLWAALLLEWLAVYAQSHLYGRPMAFHVRMYVWNGLLADTIIGNNVDLVNWTLAIEVKFYILMALLRPWVLAGRIAPLLAWSVFAILVAAAEQHGLIHLSTAFADEPMYIGFMLIGTVFHFHMTGRLGTVASLAGGALLVLLFLLCWRVGPIQNQIPSIPASYIDALALFLVAYVTRRVFRPIRWLDALADISYPLYLTHSIIGYSVMTFVIVRCRLPYDAALAIALAVVVPLAWLLHCLIEGPSLHTGKRLARRMAPRTASTPAPVLMAPD